MYRYEVEKHVVDVAGQIGAHLFSEKAGLGTLGAQSCRVKDCCTSSASVDEPQPTVSITAKRLIERTDTAHRCLRTSIGYRDEDTIG